MLPNAVVKARAEHLGIGASTLRRYLAQGAVPERGPSDCGYVPSEQALEAFWSHRGSAAAAHRKLKKMGEPGLPQLRTFQRALTRVLTNAEREDARKGRGASRNMQIYLERVETGANGVWDSDLYELPVPVRGLRGVPIFLWLAVFLDCYSRAIMGWAVGDRNHGLVLAAFGDSIRRRSETDPLRGVPDVIRPDNGLEFTADSVREGMMALGSQVMPTQPYSPNQKGKIERLWRTIDQECLLDEPLHRDAPTSAAGKPYIDSDKFEPIEDTLLIAKLEAYVEHYNWHRPHSAIGGRVPGQVWVDNVTDLNEPTAEEIRRFLLDAESRKVTKKGVRLNNLFYVAAELNKLVGEWVEVRAYPHDDRQVEIYVDEKWRCSATPSNAASAELQEAVFKARRDDHARAKRLRTTTNRRQRARMKPRSSAEAAVETTRVNAEVARREAAPRTPGSRRRRGLPGALGL